MDSYGIGLVVTTLSMGGGLIILDYNLARNIDRVIEELNNQPELHQEGRETFREVYDTMLKGIPPGPFTYFARKRYQDLLKE